jgi:hypothetical protein
MEVMRMGDAAKEKKDQNTNTRPQIIFFITRDP